MRAIDRWPHTQGKTSLKSPLRGPSCRDFSKVMVKDKETGKETPKFPPVDPATVMQDMYG